MPPLGWIPPEQRTQKQMDAHEKAIARMPRFALPVPNLPRGTKIMLTDYWKHPDVVADIGQEFTGFHQFTGSCVGVSEGNALMTVGGVQRVTSDTPTKAFIPWWPFSYGRTRYNEGDRGQGEGAVCSVMGDTLEKEGYFSCTESGLPQYKITADGYELSSQLEMQWSDGSRIDPKWLALGKLNTMGARAVINDIGSVRAAIVNGYAVYNGCNQYIGRGSIKGSGDTAYTVGQYDGNGGHATNYLGFWEHPNDGPLYLYSNQWPTSTYPRCPSGAGRCCCWTTEANAAKLFRLGGGGGECFAVSKLSWFPANPKLLDYMW